MSTANFQTMENFPLVVAEDDYVRRCPECYMLNGEDEEVCCECGASLEGIETEVDDCDCDNMKFEADRINEELTFYKVSVQSGYYSGVQFYVEFANDNYNRAEDMDNSDSQYYYGMCRSKMLRKHDAEVKRICKWLDKMVNDYGYIKLACLGHFSNGEAVYKKIA